MTLRSPRWALAVLALLVLAGCSSKPGSSTDAQTDRPVLPPDKGAISGLLIDDVYRPVAGGLLLLQGAGLTATSDALGQFAFAGLDPGTYVILASAPGHEAAPTNVDVQAGVYADAEIQARRLFSQNGTTVTTQYSVFVPCAVSAVAATETADCTGDQSGDTFRVGFTSDYTSYGANASALVTEMKANHKASASAGAFKVVVRQEGDGDYWGSKFTMDSDYVRIQMRLGNVSADDTEHRNVAWDNTKRMETLLFPQGALKNETQTGLDTACPDAAPACFESRGVGPQAGVKATFLQTLFLGATPPDLDTYHVLSPST